MMMNKLYAAAVFLAGIVTATTLHLVGGPFADKAVAADAGSAHRFNFTAIDGQPLPLSTFSGKTVLVVNTASFCGYTRQYEGLQKLYDTYESRGFVVLGVPSNDFGSQEPGTEQEIMQFCEVNFAITFPLTEKQVVIGDEAHPFYAWAHQALGAKAVPRWNFHKILIGPDGSALATWPTATEPSNDGVISTIEANLPG